MRPAGTHPLNGSSAVQLGLGVNRGQFFLLVLVNAFVGAMVGVERAVLPVLAEDAFGVASTTAVLSFLIPFGLAKAGANLLAGDLAHRVGRRRILLAGWLFGLPVPLLLAWAPSWGWVVFANLLLGINQGLAWSATVIMKIDLVGARQRGLAMGINEFAGYLAVALAALGASYLVAAHGPRSGPVWIGGGAAVLGLLLTLLFVRDTAAHVAHEAALTAKAVEPKPEALPERFRARLWRVSWTHRPLFAANQAGFVNNLNDGLAWGLLPLFFASAGRSLREIGWLAALYPAVWGIAQLGTGALSDRLGRRPLIAWGMGLQALGLLVFAATRSFAEWAAGAVILGLGTAAVYPTLIAQVSDLVTPADRASTVGVYRLWRDLGYVAGALLAGLVADLLGYRVSILAVALLTAASGVVAQVYLPTMHSPPAGRQPPG
ncbi:MAG TPA: MFS transporter [Rhodothermales bacterium]|nr:MFS transporter [Rhodothermales bacterium]